jgi:branched-chain amino acid transport system substrate-binding protein
MRYITTFVTLCAASVLAATLAAGATGAAQPKPILIGCQCDLTGAAAFAGIAGRQGIQMAISQINAHGGVAGRKLKLVTADSATTPDGGVLATRKLIQSDRVDAIISVASSTASIAASRVAAQLRVPYIASAAGDPRVLFPFSKYVYRGDSVNIAVSAKMMVTLAQKQNAQRIVLMTDTSLAYAATQRGLFLDFAEKANLNVAAQRTWTATDTDFTSQVQAVKSANADFIIIMGYPQATSKFMIQLRNAGIRTPVLGDQSLPVPDLINLGGDAVNGMKLLYIGKQVLSDTSGAMGKWLALFGRMFPNVDRAAYPNQQTVWAYADTFVLADAIRRAGPKFNADSLVRQLDRTRGFLAGTGKVYFYAHPVGLPRTYNPHDHEGTRQMAVLEVKAGKFVPVASK